MNFAIAKAAKLVLIPRFDIDMVLKAIAKEKPTLFPGVPRMYIALNENPKTAKYDLHALKACVSGAAPLPMAVAQEFERISGGAKVVEGYGLSECSPVTHANPLVGERREGSIGLPLPDTDVKLVDLDDPDREVTPGERGELCVKGPQVMLGYWNKPEETALMIRNGWLHTGDVATMDPDGLLPDRGPDQGHGAGLGFQRVSHGDRGGAVPAPEDLQVRRDRRARRRHRRAREGLHRAEGGRDARLPKRSPSGAATRRRASRATASPRTSSSATRFPKR